MTDQQTHNNQTSTTSGNTLPIKATGNAARSVILCLKSIFFFSLSKERRGRSNAIYSVDDLY
jgi:hypothetical protein